MEPLPTVRVFENIPSTEQKQDLPLDQPNNAQDGAQPEGAAPPERLVVDLEDDEATSAWVAEGTQRNCGRRVPGPPIVLDDSSDLEDAPPPRTTRPSNRPQLIRTVDGQYFLASNLIRISPPSSGGTPAAAAAADAPAPAAALSPASASPQPERGDGNRKRKESPSESASLPPSKGLRSISNVKSLLQQMECPVCWENFSSEGSGSARDAAGESARERVDEGMNRDSGLRTFGDKVVDFCVRRWVRDDGDAEQRRRRARQLVAAVCGHIFCRGCIERQIRVKGRCPICRAALQQRDIHPLYL
ncbi:unnamed protein product [Vitrella brassicaformis CCMP3155]|uniref:RING-type domain-containing protein n=1 Tax=Vitrella brassicaformis (strain CCMP3155) TaxID=1169540 RepID=A0A0G4FC75_VITBC|nr:unnamed protein product [Vitrella brassicaformis CCMP3155]|mmetsp:Transcript_22996/g.56869  ORF Transcript_22996/g.56869 Transcript_22996/m.56869 type:complete len:302 (-) Transcript_22996:416-1321(-)|eukprot:CEM10787.1 unnamed protein product [Vitrella brassicaformis CCMP3155]